MTVELGHESIVLRGSCGVEDVEDLLRLVTLHPGLPVDLRTSDWIHTALWQVLMATKAAPIGRQDGSFMMTHVLPNLGPGDI